MKSQEALMKHFSSVLRKKALGKPLDATPDPMLLKHLSRKELIHLLSLKKEGMPKELNVAEMENEELLEAIGNEMLILSHLSSQWAFEESDMGQLTKKLTEEGKDVKVEDTKTERKPASPPKPESKSTPKPKSK